MHDDANMYLLPTIPGIRLSECYLIAMEHASDLTTLNTLYIEYMRARDVNTTGFSDISDFQNENTILSEYRLEFIGEGQMFFQYKRLKVKNITGFSGDMNDDRYILPIPKSEYEKKQ